MKKKLNILLISIMLVGSLSGCKASKLTIGVTIYPIQYLVERLAGDNVNVVMLTEGTTIQRAQISADYMAKLKSMDVLFHIGSLEPYIPMYLSEIRKIGVNMVDLSATAGVYSFKRYTTSNVAGSEVTVESDYYKGTPFSTVDMYDKDPMLWMDPISMISMAKTIKDWLNKHYPEETKLFESNYMILESELAKLDAEYQLLRINKKNVGFVSITPTFGNWQKAYGLHVYPVILSKYGVIPSDNQMQIIKNKIREDGIQYIVMEPNLSEDMTAINNSVKDELGLKPISLHNLYFLTEADIAGDKDYLTIMYENLSVLESIAK